MEEQTGMRVATDTVHAMKSMIAAQPRGRVEFDEYTSCRN
jgi:hypothetical protein